MPLTGVFARLTRLHLSRVSFHSLGELGDAVSSPRCPCLQRLTVDHARGLRDLAIHSESMPRIKLRGLNTLSQLTVMAPVLKKLTVEFCFLKSPPIANISAPQLRKLHWYDEYDPSSVHLGEMRFVGIKTLFLALIYLEGIEDYDYMMEGLAVLPNITSLCLSVMANGHAFEASAFHVLRLCTGIRWLSLHLIPIGSEAQTVCTSGCKCVQQVEWETEELLLNHLEEVEIGIWRGTGHEAAFVKRLFDWGTKLKAMTVHLCDSISEVKAKELYQTFQSFSRPGVCMKFYRFENNSEVLYAPMD